jgi:hypothetical protein
MIDQDTIFLLGEAGGLERIPHRRYETEELLQRLINDYPELLVGEQIDPDQPPRWLMVTREGGIPDMEGGYDRWSIDHVLLDQNARPTLVEVKRSSDTRIRREVVGQMLDCAANARKFWPQERMREQAADHCGGLEALEEKIRELLKDQEADIETYWETVERNLREGELRLLFVADEVPSELRRIIEFLNEQMPRIEVLGIEIRQYEKAGNRILVPRVVGRTAQAEDQKSKKASRSWTIDEVLEKFKHSGSFDSQHAMKKLLDWAAKLPGVFIETGTGSTYASLRLRIRAENVPVTCMTFTPTDEGSIHGSIYFGGLMVHVESFKAADARELIATEIKQHVDSNFNSLNIEKYPTFQIRSDAAFAAVLQICEKFADAAVPNGAVDTVD